MGRWGAGQRGPQPWEAGFAGETDSNPSEAVLAALSSHPQAMTMPRPSAWIPFLVPLILLGAIGLAAAVLALKPDSILSWVGYGVAGLLLLWLAGTTFWPARADRACPECGQDALERMDPATTMGLCCTQCTYQDPLASGWFLAEEEVEGLDDLVRQQRQTMRDSKR